MLVFPGALYVSVIRVYADEFTVSYDAVSCNEWTLLSVTYDIGQTLHSVSHNMWYPSATSRENLKQLATVRS